jgi:hypothetical protein
METSDIADFILEYLPQYRKWDQALLMGWLEWHKHNGFIQRAIDFDGSLAGVAISRPIMNPKDADDFYAFDPEGSVIFVDLAIAIKPGALQALILAALQRFGMRDWIAWQRPPFHVTQFHDAHKFRRIVFRKTGVTV